MRSWIVLILLNWGHASYAEISASFVSKDDYYVFSVEQISLEFIKFEKELNSGLTNRFEVKLVVKGAGDGSVEYSEISRIRYDLWDETYIVSRARTNNETKKIVLKGLKELQENLANAFFVIPKKDMSKMSMDESVVALLSVQFNPFSEAAAEKVRKWGGSKRAGSSVPQIGSAISAGPDLRFGLLFNQILDHNLVSSSSKATWSLTQEVRFQKRNSQ